MHSFGVRQLAAALAPAREAGEKTVAHGASRGRIGPPRCLSPVRGERNHGQRHRRNSIFLGLYRRAKAALYTDHGLMKTPVAGCPCHGFGPCGELGECKSASKGVTTGGGIVG